MLHIVVSNPTNVDKYVGDVLLHPGDSIDLGEYKESRSIHNRVLKANGLEVTLIDQPEEIPDMPIELEDSEKPAETEKANTAENAEPKQEDSQAATNNAPSTNSETIKTSEVTKTSEPKTSSKTASANKSNSASKTKAAEKASK